MMEKGFPKKFLSFRDKDGSHRRGKLFPPGNQTQPTGDSFLLLFKTASTKEKSERLKSKDSKTKKVQSLLRALHISDIPDDHIHDILAMNYADGDPSKAAEFIGLEQQSMNGIIAPYDPTIKLLGAENNGFVTCYLDSLLFSMFAKLEAYESILKNHFPAEDPRHKLVNMLRLWVNMLRLGKLIQTDLVELLQKALADCGWKEALVQEQQDTSEAFAFITETLQLPLLTLQVDLFHQGRKDDDDHKVVYERLLNIAVPADPDGKGIALEDCLEEYFNTQVDVMRDSEVLKKASTDHGRPVLPQRSYTGGLQREDDVISESPLEAPPRPFPELSDSLQLSEQLNREEVADSSDSHRVKFTEETPENSDIASSSRPVPRRLSARARSSSVIQKVMIDESGRSKSIEDDNTLPSAKRKGSIIVKAVTIPAWQFFRLIPWNATQPKDGPSSNKDIVVNFEERPCVGVCLKRYTIDAKGRAVRYNTKVDIPEEMRLPHFMVADGQKEDEEAGRITADYKLVLQAVICHRGDSLQSGHYFTFAKMAPKLIRQDVRNPLDPPPDYEEATWVVFDDIADQRVAYIDDIRQALSENMPYLLLYQIVPMFDTGQDQEGLKPPSYDDYRSSTEAPPSPDALTKGTAIKFSDDSHFANARKTAFGPYNHSSPPSIRLSADFDHVGRKSSDDGVMVSYPSSSIEGDQNSGRPSAYNVDPVTEAPGSRLITPGEDTPAVSPGEESTAVRLARAASRFTKPRGSRPHSQSGESKLGISINRLGGLGGLMRQSREQVLDPATTTTTGPESEETTGLSNKEDASHLQVQDASSKKAQKRSKSKDKMKRKTQDDQPDRECLIM